MNKFSFGIQPLNKIHKHTETHKFTDIYQKLFEE